LRTSTSGIVRPCWDGITGSIVMAHPCRMDFFLLPSNRKWKIA